MANETAARGRVPAQGAHGAPGDLLRLYLAEIGRHDLLTPEEERALARRIEAGQAAVRALAEAPGSLPDDERARLEAAVAEGGAAKSRFVQANLRLVVSIVKRFQSLGIPLLDLVQEGNLGLIRAVERFDPARNVRFSTYATWWIRQAALRGLVEQWGAIKLPARTRARVAEVQRAQARLDLQLGRRATAAEVGAELGLTVEQVMEARRLGLVPRSISEPVGDDGELVELMEDRSAASPAEDAVRRSVPAAIGRLLEVLDDRERRVVQLRFGVGGEAPQTLDQVGHAMGISRERARQIERRAMRKLHVLATEAGARQLMAG
jgi:RNA polymerase primary sigma factor